MVHQYFVELLIFMQAIANLIPNQAFISAVVVILFVNGDPSSFPSPAMALLVNLQIMVKSCSKENGRLHANLSL